MKPSILVLEGRRSIGGGQVMTKKICEALSSNYEVSVFIPGNSNTPISKYLKEFRQFFYNLKEYNRGKKNLLDYLFFIYNLAVCFKALFSTLKKNKFDLIYIQHQNILPVFILVNIFFKIPSISHLHVYYEDPFARKLINTCLKNKHIKNIVAVSNYTISSLSAQVKEKSTIVYNSVKTGFQMDLHSWNNQIAIVGDVVNSKGHKILLEALKKLAPKYTLHIIGNIISSDLKCFLEKNASSVDIVFTGMLSDIPSYFKTHKIDLVVIPSIAPFETFSLSMVEAWAMGIPTIATRDFGMKEIVQTFLPQYNEIMLFRKGNSTDLSKKIALMKNSPDLKKLKKDIFETVQKHFQRNSFDKAIRGIVSKSISSNQIKAESNLGTT